MKKLINRPNDVVREERPCAAHAVARLPGRGAISDKADSMDRRRGEAAGTPGLDLPTFVPGQDGDGSSRCYM